MIEDDELLRKWSNIWNKVSKSMEKEFNRKPVCKKNVSENQNKILWSRSYRFSQ